MTTTVTHQNLKRIPPEQQKTILGHPLGLFILFFTEMWERFSYYGMRALLVLYMKSYLIANPEVADRVFGFKVLRGILESGFGPLEAQPLSSHIYGLYTGFVYLSPFFGGLLADKVWGQRKTVYIGGALMAIGHFLMAFESLFLLALFFIILGNGAFKPNISTQVGNLYKLGDERRDGAFTIFYMGVNLGAFISPLVCGALGQSLGWHYGFTAAGVGMILGLAVYHYGRKYLPYDDHERLSLEGHDIDKKGAGFIALVVGSFVACGVLFFAFLLLPGIAKALILALIFAGIAYALKQLDPSDRERVMALIILCSVTILFWAVYEQQGNTLQLWSDEKTDWTFFGFQLPSSLYQSFNPFIIFMFAPLVDLLWARRSKAGKKSSSVRKMAIGSFLLGISFVIMIAATRLVPEGARGSLLFLAATTWVFTMGELYLSPIGLSLVTKVAPPKMLSMMMGMWFLSSFIGNYLSGYIGSFYEKMPKNMFFALLCGLGLLASVIFLSFEKKLRKTIGDA